jgi:glycosyltransferase involved in cell wall biosynthesis
VNILVVTPRYAISGVPLAQARFAAALAAMGHHVTFMVGRTDSGLAIPQAPGVTVIDLAARQVRDMMWPLWHYFRRHRPEVVFAAEDHLNCMVLAAAILARSQAKISGSSRVTPFDTYSNRPLSKRWVLKQAMRALAWRADALTCVSQDMVKQYRQLFPNMGHRCVYNIVDQPENRARAAQPLDDPWFAASAPAVIVGAGSLEPWKGFDDLIEAFAVLARRRSDIRLMILGEGSQRAKLEALVVQRGLTESVRLPGRKDNPLSYFSQAKVFALSSHVEGMPNVLVEAMLCGCTPVATDCPTGPAELLQDGRFGYLATPGDPVSIAQALEQALEQPIPPHVLAEAIIPFEQSHVIARHFDLLGLSGA